MERGVFGEASDTSPFIGLGRADPLRRAEHRGHFLEEHLLPSLVGRRGGAVLPRAEILSGIRAAIQKVETALASAGDVPGGEAAGLHCLIHPMEDLLPGSLRYRCCNPSGAGVQHLGSRRGPFFIENPAGVSGDRDGRGMLETGRSAIAARKIRPAESSSHSRDGPFSRQMGADADRPRPLRGSRVRWSPWRPPGRPVVPGGTAGGVTAGRWSRRRSGGLRPGTGHRCPPRRGRSRGWRRPAAPRLRRRAPWPNGPGRAAKRCGSASG